MIDDPVATDRLLVLAREDDRAEVRSTAIFWLGQKAGDRIAETIRDAVRNDPAVEVKKAAVFVLSQLPPDEGVPMLIAVARSNRHIDVRRAAMFWLGQSRDRRALGF